LDREADGDVSWAVENLKDMVAEQTTKLALGPLFGNKFDAPVAGATIRAEDIGSFHPPNLSAGGQTDQACEVGSCSGLSGRLSDKWLNSKPISPDRTEKSFVNEATHMLAEKFILLLETVISRTYPDGSPRVVSTSRHVPIKLPSKTTFDLDRS
jgi:hypothetical protein